MHLVAAPLSVPPSYGYRYGIVTNYSYLVLALPSGIANA